MENIKDNQNKKRLGRGIGSLLGGDTFNEQNEVQIIENKAEQKTNLNTQKVTTTIENAVTDDKRVWQVAIDKIVPGIFQPRKHFNKEPLEELAQSIKQNGIIQPLTLRKRSSGGYEIIAGERRWRAAQIAGLHEVPAILRDYTDKEALEIALIENIQREDLDPIEEAEGYQRLMQEFALSQQQVAEKVGKERSTVANSLRLMVLPTEVKNLIAEGLLSTGHAKVLLGLESRSEQIKLAKQVCEKQISVRALEALIKTHKQSPNLQQTSKNSPLNVDLSQRLAKELSEQLQKTLGTKVVIDYKNGKGTLTVHFYSDDQLNNIYEKIK